jgi:hypothetical protein
MKTKLGREFESFLNNISDEDFDLLWNNIDLMNLAGPSLDIFFNYLTSAKEISKNFESPEVSEDFSNAGENNYALAA